MIASEVRQHTNTWLHAMQILTHTSPPMQVTCNTKMPLCEITLIGSVQSWRRGRGAAIYRTARTQVAITCPRPTLRRRLFDSATNNHQLIVPDICVWDKSNQVAQIIDVAITMDRNMVEKIAENSPIVETCRSKYRNARICKKWPQFQLWWVPLALYLVLPCIWYEHISFVGLVG